ncbi:MAG: hypothetical protein ACXVP5_03750 [Tumebacillaceae bacterium]
MTRTQILERYRAVTEQLLELLVSATDLLDTSTMEALLTERDELIATYEQTPLTAEEDRTALLAEIQKFDLAFQSALREKFDDTREKVNDFQSKRRATHAYGNSFGYGAAFIDRKK